MSDLKRHPQTITAAEAEMILTGVRIDGKPELDELAAAMAGVRAVATQPPAREIIEAQLTAISELLDRTRSQTTNYALAGHVDRTVATDRTVQADRTIEAANYALATPADRTMDRTVRPAKYALMAWIYDRTMGTLRRRAYALSTAMVIATGSAAAAGVLPATAQDALADAASRVGIAIPHANDDDVEKPDTQSQEVKPASESASDVAVAVHVVIASRDQYGNGNDFGQAVAQAARDAANERREAGRNNANKGTPAAGASSDPGSQADGAKNTSARADNAPEGGREFGEDKAREARS